MAEVEGKPLFATRLGQWDGGGSMGKCSEVWLQTNTRADHNGRFTYASLSLLVVHLSPVPGMAWPLGKYDWTNLTWFCLEANAPES